VEKRSERRWLGLASALTVLACACSVVGMAGVVWLARQLGGPSAVSGPALSEMSSVGRIAYVGGDGNIYTIAPDGAGRQAVTNDQPAGNQEYNALAWSPDGQLAFALANDKGSDLFMAQADGSRRTRLYSGGPNVAPFYLYWSPDSQRIAFLSPSRVGGMALWMADSGKADSAHSIGQGSPSYFSWSPDSQSLLSHVGGAQNESGNAHLSILHPGESGSIELPDVPGNFQAPAWSPDGQSFLVVRQTDQGTDELVLAEGDDRRVLTGAKISPRSGLAFAWSPRGDRIAFATLSPRANSLYDSVVVMNPADQTSRVMAQGQIAAFFWSPDGERLAVLWMDVSEQGPQGRVIPARWSPSPAPQSSSVRLAWSVVNVADGATVDFPSFRPTDAFLLLIPYFDQYAQSLSLWSPDGRQLVYADVDDRQAASIRVLDTTQPNQPARRLVSGTFAAWSWH
jgi:TolB protein